MKEANQIMNYLKLVGIFDEYDILESSDEILEDIEVMKNTVPRFYNLLIILSDMG